MYKYCYSNLGAIYAKVYTNTQKVFSISFRALLKKERKLIKMQIFFARAFIISTAHSIICASIKLQKKGS